MKQFLSLDQYAEKYELSLQGVLDLVAAGRLESVLDPHGVVLLEDDLPLFEGGDGEGIEHDA